ncbi:Torso-like protein-like [Homarus americanus]|uniref:Torso-like protein-like n=1 Tax=Homarus americanus TaxID=6706 RepID=A0A8J5K683_HOMAM|nr:Torso-like protein-like [Homarus americanus]
MGVGVGTSWAALILAVCVLCGESKNSTTRDADEDNDIITSSDYLKVGRSLNLLPRYGFLTLSIKVFPHRYDNSWLFRDKTAEVFQKNSYWASQTKRRNQQHQVTQTDRHGYDQHFLIDFCDDVRDLLTAYFDNFYIEGVPEPHRVFITSLATKTKAQHLGIHPTFLSTEYSFVLVRLFRRNRRSTLDGRLTLTPNFKSAVNDIRIGSSESVNQFLDLYGTHVITEYEVGDIMYQVYVFGERTYGELKNNFAMSQSSQSNDQFEDMVGNQLTSITYFRLYQSIFSIFKNQELEKKLEELEGEVVLSLKLEKITKIVPKSPERRWLGEVLDNTLSLYYVTM